MYIKKQMNKIITLLFALIIVSCGQTNQKNYNELVNKHINDNEVANFLKKLGSNYEFDDSYLKSYGAKYYIYGEKGIELNFNESDTLEAIFFKLDKLNPEIELPLNIKQTDTRDELEEKMGKADSYFVGLQKLSAYYLNKDMVIVYKSKDTLNMSNGIRSISIQKLDKEKILEIK